MSYLRLLVPVAAVAVILCLIMVILTQWIIPRFYGYMGRLLATDAAVLLQHSVSKGVPFPLGGLQFYADGMGVIE